MEGTFQSRYVRVIVLLLAGLWILIGFELAHRRPAATSIPPHLGVLAIHVFDRTQALDRPIPRIEIKNASLEDAIALLARQADADIIVRIDEQHIAVKNPPFPAAMPATRPSQLISLTLEHVTLGTALRAILRSANPMFTYGIDDSGCIVVTADWEHAPATYAVYDLSDIPADVPFPQPAWSSPPPTHILGLIPDSHYALAEMVAGFLRTDDVIDDRHTAWQRPAPLVIAWAGRLIVHETPDNQRRVREILRLVRADLKASGRKQ